MKKKYRGVLAALVYCVVYLVPIILFIHTFAHMGIQDFLFEQKTGLILYHTFVQAGLSVLFSFIIAIVPALYISRKDNFLTSLGGTSLFIPFFFPPVSAGIAISLVLRSTGLNYTLFAVVLAHMFYNSPIIVKYLAEALRTIDRATIEAARIDGAGRLSIFVNIELPQILDGAVRGGFLAFIYCFTSFAVILSVGSIKYSTFEVAIASALSGSQEFSRVCFYAVIQFGILMLINLLLPSAKESGRSYRTATSKQLLVFPMCLTLLYVIFEFGIVGYATLFAFIDPYVARFDLSPFITIFTAAFNKRFPVILSIINSLFISGVTAFLTTSITYVLLSIRTKMTDTVILVTLGISSAFTGIVLYYLHVLFAFLLPLLVIAGIFFLTVPIAYSFMYDQCTHFDSQLIDAARTDGADSLSILRYIRFPLLKRTLIGTFLQIFTIAYGEFTLVFSMKIQHLLPLSSIVNYMIGSRRLFRESAAMSTINSFIVIVLFLLSSHMSKEKKH